MKMEKFKGSMGGGGGGGGTKGICKKAQHYVQAQESNRSAQPRKQLGKVEEACIGRERLRVR